MSQWARSHPEEYEEIAALPPSQQNAALREAIGYDPDAIRDRLEEEEAVERESGIASESRRVSLTQSRGSSPSETAKDSSLLADAPAPSEPHSAHVLGQRDKTSPGEVGRPSLPRSASSGEGTCGACGAPDGVPCSPTCESNR